jgi:hypothetical protein
MTMMQEKYRQEKPLEVGQCVGDSENPEKKAVGHNGISFAKMANLLEYCGLVNR